MDQFRPSRFEVLPLVVKNLLIINGLVFLGSFAYENFYHSDLSDLLALRYITSPDFKPYQLITHMFMHANFMHLFSNMFSLWMFGSVLENVWGPKRFLIFYMICGLGGALCHMVATGFELHQMDVAFKFFLSHPDQEQFMVLLKKYPPPYELSTALNGVTNIHEAIHFTMQLYRVYENTGAVGASGAVFGVLVGFGMLFPNTVLYMIFIPIPIKAKYFVIFYAAFELYAGISGTEAGVAHFAHLGGAALGFILVKLWNKSNRTDFF